MAKALTKVTLTGCNIQKLNGLQFLAEGDVIQPLELVRVIGQHPQLFRELVHKDPAFLNTPLRVKRS